MNNQTFQKIVDGNYGRKIAKTNEEAVTDTNVLKIVNIGINAMHHNRTAVEYLNNYKKGDQPVLYRTRTGRDDINNPVVENHAYELIEFEVGQTYGEPVQCVALKNDEKINKAVDTLNDYYRGANKQAVDIEVGEWVSTCGFGYKAVQRKKGEVPFRLINCDPSNTTIVYSDITKEPLLAVEEFVQDDGKVYYMCFDNTYSYKIIPKGAGIGISEFDTIVEKKLHGFSDIPIVEYRNNADCLSSIELVISMLDAINEVQSNRVDNVADIVQSYLKFVNCEIDETQFNKMKEQGALVVHSNSGDAGGKADVDFISTELNQGQTQTLKDDMYNNSLQILAIPNREGNTGGDTQGAVSLRNGWDAAKLRAKTRDPFVVKSEKQIAMLVLNELRIAKIDCKLGIMDFDINIVHSPTDNLLVKSEALEILLRSGIHPLVAIRVCGLWSDAEKTFMESKPYLDAIYKTIDDKIKELELETEVEKAKGILQNQQNGQKSQPTEEKTNEERAV